ncbi:MAG: tetratricopeptide repeat protein [Bacteroidales bacterium]|nr:tetratricopeptide repeat protein [Bacteroidales bacterium]
MRRAYHNLTCHYNVWWNGDVSLNEGALSLSTTAKENYNEVLPVFNYGTKQEAMSLNPKMDRAIKKASIGIQRHSMYFGGKEYVKWIDDSYLMMGMAHFYKQDYTSARRVFDYIAKEYVDAPIHYEAYLWLAKTHIQTGRFEKAEAALNLLLVDQQEGKSLPKTVEQNLPMVYADFFIAQENYDAAYPYLERGLELGNKKYILTRAEFILGQINQMSGDLEFATRYYQKVIKRNPDYKMAFEARINMAQCYDEGTGDSKYINKVLHKMAKDAKNKEFLDQIYYALAEIALKDHNDTLAISYLRKSVSVSKQDNYQKSTSALKVAGLFFDKGDYSLSQAYYDTAVSVLPKEYPNYDIIKSKAAVLSELVVHIQTIYEQDSLQRLSSLDTNTLYAMIDGIIEEYIIEKERLEAEAEKMAEMGGTQFVDVNGGKSMGQPRALGGGKWYFYNPTAMSMGYSEFIKKWGNRKLEDNWRLTDKRMVMSAYEDEELVNDSLGSDSTHMQSALVTDPEKREYYLANIPRTDEELLASTEQIIEAYNKLGFLYLEELTDTVNATETYLEFQERFPDNKYRLQSWYALYKIYNEQGNAQKAAYYKSLIVGNYPDSDFAKVIVDPDYFIRLSEQKNLAAKLYEKTYKAYKREQYYRVITYANKGMKQYPNDTAIMPRFMYLRAVSLGKVDVPDTMYVAINTLIQDYPSSPVIPMAKAVLRILQSEYGIGEAIVDEQGKPGGGKSRTLYAYQPDDLHLMMMVIISSDVNINALKVRVSDFKNKYFRLARLRIKSLMLDNQRTLITIGNFDDAGDAEDFTTALKNDEYVLSGMEDKDFDIVSISIKNYPIFYKDKNTKDYLEFYNENYKNEKK